jgi:hypothetical protein
LFEVFPMRLLVSALASLALLGSASAAFAAPVNYTLTGTTTSGYGVTGTFSLDSATDAFLSADIMENGAIEYNNIAVGSVGAGTSFAFINTTPTSALELLLSVTSGGTPVLCTGACFANSEVLFTPIPNYTIDDTLASGSISEVAPAATPEPSSLMLLGTGMLGAAGAARRRFIKR